MYREVAFQLFGSPIFGVAVHGLFPRGLGRRPRSRSVVFFPVDGLFPRDFFGVLLFWRPLQNKHDKRTSLFLGFGLPETPAQRSPSLFASKRVTPTTLPKPLRSPALFVSAVHYSIQSTFWFSVGSTSSTITADPLKTPVAPSNRAAIETTKRRLP